MVEILILACVGFAALAFVCWAILRQTEKAILSMEKVTHRMADHTEQNVGGSPLALLQQEQELKARAMVLDEKKTELEMRIREAAARMEMENAAIEFQNLRPAREFGMPPEVNDGQFVG